MPDTQQPHGFMDWLQTQWWWIVALCTGAAHATKAQSDINRLKEQVTDLKNVPERLSGIEAKLDILLEDRKK